MIQSMKINQEIVIFLSRDADLGMVLHEFRGLMNHGKFVVTLRC